MRRERSCVLANFVCRFCLQTLSSEFVCRDAKPKGRRTRQIFATSFLQAHRETEAHLTATATPPIGIVPFQARHFTSR